MSNEPRRRLRQEGYALAVEHVAMGACAPQPQRVVRGPVTASCNSSNSPHSAACLSLTELVPHPGEDIKGLEPLHVHPLYCCSG